jgi:2-succinyl-5-enolpyruvyl-6-hydroxy-3-cyclohexene-1-carboxylate synthase
MEDGLPILQLPAPPVAAPLPAGFDLAECNLAAALLLLRSLHHGGLRHVVVCPGSRSAPLASAAGLLARRGWIRLLTGIDERSAAFFALGLGRSTGDPAAVLTTSGSAVANLLPACIEADYGTIPLLLLTADRPGRLKGCGANQTVNQEDFLLPSLRWFGAGDARGLAEMDGKQLISMAQTALEHCRGGLVMPPGPVHLNLPFEEPLHPAADALNRNAATLASAPELGTAVGASVDLTSISRAADPVSCGLAALDPDCPGLVIAGPWRGRPEAWPNHVAALRRWQRRSGWPVLADGLSGLRGCHDLAVVAGYDLLGTCLPPVLRDCLPALQLLRLGPMPASRRLQNLVQACGGVQVLITESEPRCLDPLMSSSLQWPAGLAAWTAQLPADALGAPPSAACLAWAAQWQALEQTLQQWLDARLLPVPSPGLPGPWGEPMIARRLADLLPEGLPLVIANSSPVRDWETFTPSQVPFRPIHSFRGASGIDGTLSIACGVAEAAGQAVLLSGDLALLHDSNGWLWFRQLSGSLTVVLIDNGGGGIFEQLPIRQDGSAEDFEQLFAMPQGVDQAALAAAHGVPSRQVSSAADLAPALSWALEQRRALLVLRTDRRADAIWRQDLRRMASRLVDHP